MNSVQLQRIKPPYLLGDHSNMYEINVAAQKCAFSSTGKLLCRLMIIFAVLVGSGYYLSFTRHIKAGIIVLLVLFVLVLYLLYNKRNSTRIKVITFFYLFCHIISILLTFVANSETESLTVTALLIINDLFALCVSFFYDDDSQKFLKDYFTAILVCSTISVIGYIIVHYLSLIHLPIVFVPDSKTYYYSGIIYAQVNESPRNTSIFWEPGLYSTLIALSLLFKLYIGNIKKHISISSIFLVLVIFLTCMATSGVILCLVLSVVFLQKKWRNSGHGTVIIANFIMIPIIIFIFVFSDTITNYLGDLAPNIFGKVIKSEISYTSRIDGPAINLSIFKQAPLVGKGLLGSNLMFEDLIVNDSFIDARVDTITTNLAAFGFGGFIPLFYIIIGIIHQSFINTLERLYIVLFFVIMFFCEPYSSLTILPVITVLFLQNKSVLQDNVISTMETK